MAVDDDKGRQYLSGEGRYEFVLSPEQAGLPMIVIGRLDAAELPQLVYDQLKMTAALVLAFVIVLIVTGVAVTQRRSAEKRSDRELRAREKRLTGVVEHSPSAIYLKSMDGRMLMLNKEYERLNGIDRDQVVGKSVREIFPPDAAERMAGQDQQIIESKTVIRQQHEYSGPDGEVRTVAQTKFPILNDDGDVVLIGSIATDITERQEIQNALVESERRYRRLIESLPGAVYVQVDGRIVFVNFAAQRMFCADSPENLVGLKSTDLFHPDDRIKIAQRRKAARQPNVVMPLIEVIHLRLDGTTFEGESASTKIVWQGEPAILVEIRDITDRKFAERIAQKNQDQYRQFMEMMPDAVFVQCNDKVVFVNPATVKMFGARSADDMIGKSALELTHHEDWEKSGPGGAAWTPGHRFRKWRKTDMSD